MIMLLMSLLFASHAFPSELKIFELKTSNLGYKQDFSFNANLNQGELGRAWVNMRDHSHDPDLNSTDYRIKVPGLSYDASTSTIYFTSEMGRVDCAFVKVRGRSIFRSIKIRATGNCKVSKRFVEETIDNGFEVHKKKLLQVFFSI